MRVDWPTHDCLRQMLTAACMAGMGRKQTLCLGVDAPPTGPA
jgi:hypothetical protein